MIRRSGILGEPVTVTSASGLMLDGLVFEAAQPEAIVVHVHGSYGNFYQAPFLRDLVKAYRDRHISMLCVNSSSHDGFGEAYFSDGRFAYAGGAVSDFGSGVCDIQGMIDFAEGLAERVILQGHSLGCDRVLSYSLEKEAKHELVLLAPCDSYNLQSRWLRDETVEDQIARLTGEQRDQEMDWLPLTEYGVRQGEGWTYCLPVTRSAFLSIANGAPFKLINLAKPASYQIPVSAAIYIGGKDPLQTWASSEMFAYLEQRLGGVHRLMFENGDHMLSSCERAVAAALGDWIVRERP